MIKDLPSAEEMFVGDGLIAAGLTACDRAFGTEFRYDMRARLNDVLRFVLDRNFPDDPIHALTCNDREAVNEAADAVVGWLRRGQCFTERELESIQYRLKLTRFMAKLVADFEASNRHKLTPQARTNAKVLFEFIHEGGRERVLGIMRMGLSDFWIAGWAVITYRRVFGSYITSEQERRLGYLFARFRALK